MFCQPLRARVKTPLGANLYIFTAFSCHAAKTALHAETFSCVFTVLGRDLGPFSSARNGPRGASVKCAHARLMRMCRVCVDFGMFL